MEIFEVTSRTHFFGLKYKFRAMLAIHFIYYKVKQLLSKMLWSILILLCFLYALTGSCQLETCQLETKNNNNLLYLNIYISESLYYYFRVIVLVK